jgi:hypothetical protein
MVLPVAVDGTRVLELLRPIAARSCASVLVQTRLKPKR